MLIKWNKAAIRQLIDAILFIEETGFYTYADEVERDILSRIRNLTAAANRQLLLLTATATKNLGVPRLVDAGSGHAFIRLQALGAWPVSTSVPHAEHTGAKS
jgi:hypothetical protein